MVDLTKIAAAFLVGYAVFMVLIVGLVRTFFPFIANEELKHQKKRIRHYKINAGQIG